MGGLLGHKDHLNQREQSLMDHSKNVAILCKDFLKVLGLESLGFLVGMIHDMGKACLRIQTHIKTNNNDRIDHATVAAQYLYKNEFNAKDPFHVLLFQYISMVVMSHHTGLENFVDTVGRSNYINRLKKSLDTYEEACATFLTEVYSKEEIHNLFEKGKKEIEQIYSKIDQRNCEFSSAEGTKMTLFELNLLGRFIFGSLIDADRTDSANFENDKELKKEQTKLTPKWERYYGHVMDYLSQFNTQTKINRLRTEISDQCADAGDYPQGIYELNVPTGGGKTIASLRFALRHAMKHKNIEHIYYVIPYNTILNQNASTIQEILFGEKYPPEDEFLLHNSTVVSEWKSNQEKAEFGEMEFDEDRYLKYTQRWNSNIIMTTTVQFLNTLFNGTKKDARRMHQLSNSIIILDEVQCLPIKTLHMFNTAMNFLHYVCHSTILLCTATQPQLQNLGKPIQLSKHASLIQDYDTYYTAFKRVELINQYRNEGYKIDEFAHSALSQISEGMSALIVMNTKSQARKVYDIFKNERSYDATIYHLSTSMCHAHRQHTLHHVMRLMKEGKPVILISTNLIEAGVDISFPIVFRAMAGMDSIIQCAGRCNRNNEMNGGLGKIFVYNIAYENLKYLKDIQLKKECTTDLLIDFNEDPSEYDYDLMSLKSMHRFYQIYNNKLKKKDKLDYIVDEDKENGQNQIKTIYDMLSDNEIGIQKCNYDYSIAFAYEEAGKEFCVIDQKCVDVIVPYEEGEQIITELFNQSSSFEDVRSLLQKAQNYTVSLYPYQIEAIGSHIHYDPDLGIRFLDASNYDDQLGVVLDGECLGLFV